MKISNYFVILLLLPAIGCFLPAARAEEQDKDVHPKPGHSMPGSTKPGPSMPAPPKNAPQMPGQSIQAPPTPPHPITPSSVPGHPMPPPVPAHQKTNIPHGQYGEVQHEVEHREGQRGDLHRYTGHDFNHWSEQEQTIWRSGAWRHERYKGRFGWWWNAGGMMYFYEEPVYPYPQVLPETEYELPVEDQQQPEYTQEPSSDPYYWYYCQDPKGYYPYIAECPGGWMTVVPEPAASEE